MLWALAGKSSYACSCHHNDYSLDDTRRGSEDLKMSIGSQPPANLPQTYRAHLNLHLPRFGHQFEIFLPPMQVLDSKLPLPV